jgi:hypothetical protein
MQYSSGMPLSRAVAFLAAISPTPRRARESFAIPLISFEVMRPTNSLRQVKTGKRVLIEYLMRSKIMVRSQNLDRGATPAKREDVQAILGNIDEGKLIEILELRPTVADLEEAVVVAAGDNDILGKSGHSLSAAAAEIADILARDEEDPARER